MERICEQQLEGTIGVAPLGNETEETLELDGTDDLMMAAMTESGCFRVIERAKLDLLINEMRLCAEDNPDREYFDCGSFAQRGHILGLETLVVGDVIFFERRVRGSELATAIPGIGSVQADLEYSALAISLRAVRVETGEVSASTVVHAVVTAGEGAVDVGTGAFSLRTAVSSRTAMGQELHEMIQEAVRRLHRQIEA